MIESEIITASLRWYKNMTSDNFLIRFLEMHVYYSVWIICVTSDVLKNSKCESLNICKVT
jgi:hypothetical protein